jgi:hypothetical protein
LHRLLGLILALAVWPWSALGQPSPANAPPQKLDPKRIEERLKQLSNSKPAPADFREALRDQLQKCWKPIPGVERGVTVTFLLTRDGRLAAPPKVLDADQGAESAAVAKAAVNAVKTCQPFKLPVDKYEQWKNVEVRFDTKNFAEPRRSSPEPKGSLTTPPLPPPAPR